MLRKTGAIISRLTFSFVISSEIGVFVWFFVMAGRKFKKGASDETINSIEQGENSSQNEDSWIK